MREPDKAGFWWWRRDECDTWQMLEVSGLPGGIYIRGGLLMPGWQSFDGHRATFNGKWVYAPTPDETPSCTLSATGV